MGGSVKGPGKGTGAAWGTRGEREGGEGQRVFRIGIQGPALAWNRGTHHGKEGELVATRGTSRAKERT
eukprot:175120-Chlamydomonas_euryale.AAC.1